MQESSFYKFCIGACIFIIFFSLSINFLSIISIFPLDTPGFQGNYTEGLNKTVANSNLILGIFTGDTLLFTITGLLVGTGLIGAIALAISSKNWNIVSVYIFITVFWGSWISNLGIFTNNSFYDYPAVKALIVIITIGMMVLFIGAIAGLLHLGEG